MTTQARERREETMPPKAGRGKAAMHAEGRAKKPKKDAGDVAEPVIEVGSSPDAVVWPVVRISRRAAARVRAGHPWVYQSDVEEMITKSGENSVAPGSLVTVVDERGVALGTAMYSDASLITLRMVTRELISDRDEFLELVRRRLRRAVQMRLDGLKGLTGDERLQTGVWGSRRAPGNCSGSIWRFGDFATADTGHTCGRCACDGSRYFS